MKFGKMVALITGAVVLSMAGAARATVTLNSPSNGATVNGTIKVTAQITSAWWSKLWVDGKGIAVAGSGNVTFTWNTTSFADGTHTLVVDAYPSGSSIANAAHTIQVAVKNSGSSGFSGHFYTLPKSASLPSDAICAAEIPWEQEMIPDNEAPNNTKPTSSQLQA